jgi:CRISPR/Cas system-associated endoribonuclease Cas2
MPRFIIAYDLRNPDHDYEPLYKELKRIQAQHIQDSVWAVRLPGESQTIYETLWRHMHNTDDRLLVAQLDDKNFVSKNGMHKISEL